jgi:hypothetical protein
VATASHEYGTGAVKVILRRELELQKKYAGRRDALHVPGLLGGVGIGKTSIVYSIAKELGYTSVVKINCGEEADPTELMGLWRVDRTGTIQGTKKRRKGGKDLVEEYTLEHTEWLLNKRAARAAVQPVLLFMDDIDKADGPIQNALLQVVGERRIRDTQLHRDTVMVAAGNRVTDDIYAKPINESLKTRINFMEVRADINDFIDYGHETQEIHPSILGFLAKNPDLLHAKSDNLRFPTPRTWREVSMHFYTYPDAAELVYKDPPLLNWKEAVNRKCGTGVGEKFWAWHDILSRIDVNRILDFGDVVPANQLEEFASVWAVIGELRSRKKLPKARGLDKYLLALSPEIRTAVWAQLPTSMRAWFSTECPNTSAAINKAAAR